MSRLVGFTAYENAKTGLTKDDVRRGLPVCGQEMTCELTVAGNSVIIGTSCRVEGTVVDVNTEHMFYTMQFHSGIRESYKLPVTKQ